MLQVRVTPVGRDFQLLLDDSLGGPARSKALAEFARREIEEATEINRLALGYPPPLTIYVDGRRNAPLESVQPGGTIVADFTLVNNVIEWIRAQLDTHSPVKSGRYRQSHVLFADGQQVGRNEKPPPAEEYVFVNTVPYARKIERGASSQTPDGVYQVVAVLAQRQFRSLASITFAYRAVISGLIIGGRRGNRAEDRNPAIIVRPRT
jgi:hypothetical protein